MKQSKEALVAIGAGIGAALSGLTPKDWTMLEQVAVAAVAAAVFYAVVKAAWRATDSGCNAERREKETQ